MILITEQNIHPKHVPHQHAIPLIINKYNMPCVH